jgi:steroid 5-alpha reductase family enzyme
MIRVVFEGWALLAIGFALLWVWHLRLRNAAVVDAGWACGVPLLAAWYAYRLPSGPAAWLMAALAALWGFRLAGYLLAVRVIGQPEEGRYAELRRRWKTSLPAKFFVFFQAQALLDVVLSVPFLLVARQPRDIGLIEIAGAVVWLVGVAGEATADAQLARFKRDPANRGRVCDTGLWRYSRHPNYFFEWLVWVGYAVAASGAPFGWLAWIAPALILVFLFRVTGIPETEAQSLRSRGDAYRRYQETTSVFVPLPVRTRRARQP